MKIFTVIMAGGVGTRFWPRSREKSPKQLLHIFGNNTMIQDTVNRLEGLVENENIFVITNKIQKPGIVEQLPNVPSKNIIEEPFGRNTAACIGLAALLIKKISSDAVTVILPADHIIKEKDIFQDTIIKAAEFAFKKKALLTIGVPPSRPETGYGYIQIDDRNVEDNIYKVYTFAEKPNYATAKRFVESGDFLWNSGMFIWRADTILEEIKFYMPDLYSGLEELEPFLFTENFDSKLAEVYGQLRSISIDYGIMEKSKKVFLTKGKFTWSDVGSWEEVYQQSPKDENGNALIGNVYTDAVNESYIYSPERITAAIGVANILIINTDDALLVCRRDQAQEVKKVVDYLKLNKQNKYL